MDSSPVSVTTEVFTKTFRNSITSTESYFGPRGVYSCSGSEKYINPKRRGNDNSPSVRGERTWDEVQTKTHSKAGGVPVPKITRSSGNLLKKKGSELHRVTGDKGKENKGGNGRCQFRGSELSVRTGTTEDIETHWNVWNMKGKRNRSPHKKGSNREERLTTLTAFREGKASKCERGVTTL